VREISQPEADQRRIIENALGLRLVLASIAMAIAIGAAFVLPLQAQDRLGILGGAFGFLAYSVHLLLFGLFQQKLRQQGVVLAELSGGIVLVLLILLFAWAGAAPAWFATAMGMSYVLTLLVTVIAARRFLHFRPRFQSDVWRRLTKEGAPLAVVWTMSALYTRADIALLAILNTPLQVGLYGVPAKIYDSLIGIALLFVGMFAPLLANTARNHTVDFHKHLQSALAALGIGIVGVAVAIVATAPELVWLLAGREFLDSAPVLQLMAALLVIRSGTLLLRETIIALQMQRRLLPVYAATFATAFAGYFVLIPPLGGIGAVLAFLLGEVVLLLCMGTIVVRAAASPKVFAVPLAALICGLATSGFVLWMEAESYNFVTRAILAGAAYLALLFATRALTMNTLASLKHDILARKS
jgi:O-antigen/teichoic acid export membrane protein